MPRGPICRYSTMSICARMARMMTLCLCMLAVPANARICKYVDADGASHFTNVPPDKGWKLVDCDIAEPLSDQQRQREQDKWRAIIAKVKVGMTTSELRAISGLWPRLRDRRTVESTSGVDEWFSFADGPTVHVHNGKVATIYRQ